MDLYSKAGTYPAELPFRITLPNGYTRTDPSTFTAEEIVEAGYVLAPAQPAYDPALQELGWDGAAWTLTDIPQPPPPTLEEVRAEAIARVNAEAGAERAKHITVTIGQEGTYVEKDAEATAYLAASAPAEADFPYLSAEARHTGMTVQAVAELVKATADQWTALNAEIEGIRRGALVRVENAATVDEVRAVFPITWPSPPA